ncbi:hypothetical protein GCM10023350_11020 [Nocardioides endophyticus]|uniref:Peptidase C-terminal archaeal/bacterial domain-containing protein n=1 Tax=Nocardioides endophyticus TaxID=1353775 RepID=A0ABP8YHS4_9ACTN
MLGGGYRHRHVVVTRPVHASLGRSPRRLLSLLLGALIGIAGLVTVPAPAFAAPANDNFADAQVLTGAPVTVTGSNAAATKEPGERSHADNAGGKSVWFSWTAPDYGSVDVDLAGSSFDTLLAVYTGDSVGDLVLIGSVDDTPSGGRQGRISFPVVAGTTYRIAVDGYDGASGSIKLALDFGIATTGVVAGQVVDGQQVGLGLVCVAVYGEDGAGVGYAVTDGSGHYRVNDVEPGDYRVGFNDLGGAAGLRPASADDPGTRRGGRTRHGLLRHLNRDPQGRLGPAQRWCHLDLTRSAPRDEPLGLTRDEPVTDEPGLAGKGDIGPTADADREAPTGGVKTLLVSADRACVRVAADRARRSTRVRRTVPGRDRRSCLKRLRAIGP